MSKRFTSNEIAAFDDVSPAVEEFFKAVKYKGQLICSADSVIYKDGDRRLECACSPNWRRIQELRQIIKQATVELKQLGMKP